MRSTRPYAFAATLAALLAAGVFPQAAGAAHGSQARPVRLTAQLACLPAGGAGVKFSIANIGRRSVAIDEDFHLRLTIVRSGGPEFGGIVFVFPIPELAVISPGGMSTFLVPIGDAVEPGELGVDLSGHRVLLEADVFLDGRRQPVGRLFSFRGCSAPSRTWVG